MDLRQWFLNLVITVHVDPCVAEQGNGKRVWDPEDIGLWGACGDVRRRMLR